MVIFVELNVLLFMIELGLLYGHEIVLSTKKQYVIFFVENEAGHGSRAEQNKLVILHSLVCTHFCVLW